MSQFRDHYSRLHDEALVELALRGGLTDEATADLLAELQSRGINDLSPYKAELERESRSEERHRQDQLAFRAKVVRWRTRAILAVGLASCAYGVFRLVVPNRMEPWDDGGIEFVVGIALIVFALVSARFSKWWSERVLLRKPAP
jgi:hypothetical protein